MSSIGVFILQKYDFGIDVYFKYEFIVLYISSLRGQRTLYDRRLTRYGKPCNFVILKPPENKTKNVFLGLFRFSEGYAYL